MFIKFLVELLHTQKIAQNLNLMCVFVDTIRRRKKLFLNLQITRLEKKLNGILCFIFIVDLISIILILLQLKYDKIFQLNKIIHM